MRQDKPGAGPSGAAPDPDDRHDHETTERRKFRASRAPRRARRAKVLLSRAAVTGELPAIEEEILDTTVVRAIAPATTAAVTVPAVEDEPDEDVDDVDKDESPRASDEPAWIQNGRWIMVTALLGITVLTLTGVAIYLTDVVEQWQVRADDLTEANYALGDQVAEQADTIAAQTDQIDILTTQLSTAQDRISELASLSANSDDALAYAEQRVDLLAGYASTGAAVANALTRCLDGEQQLVEYLSNPDDYDEDEVSAYADSVDELCTAARESNSAFQKMLSE